MRFKSFLLQEHGYYPDEIQRTLHKFLEPCKHFIKENKSTILSGRFFLRGMKDFSTNKGIGRLETKSLREPRDTNVNVHYKLSKYFRDKFGTDYRQEHVMFARQTNFELVEYGKIHMVFPEGSNYKMCFSPNTKDLTINADPWFEQSATYSFAVFIEKNKSKYTRKPLIELKSHGIDQVDFITYLFLGFYWCSNVQKFRSINEDFSKDDFLENLVMPYSLKKDLAEILNKIDKYKTKTTASYMAFILSVLGYKSIEEFKEVLVSIGEGFMNSLKYRENTKYLGFKPFDNEVMIQCKSYVAVPHHFQKELLGYIHDQF